MHHMQALYCILGLEDNLDNVEEEKDVGGESRGWEAVMKKGAGVGEVDGYGRE